MKLKYITQIRANISIASNKKTSNILDGTYKSVYKGKSMNFENLREYVINDDIKDIDWKASSRSGSLLVKQFIAEKKHNIMLVMDTGKKMSADTNTQEQKKEVALFTAGTIGYLAIKNGDYVGMLYNKQENVIYQPFQYDLYHLEQYLTNYDHDAESPIPSSLIKSLKYLSRNIKKRMIIFIITDLNGLESLDDKILKELSVMHNVLVISIEDAYMQNENTFDVINDQYLPNFILHDKKLALIEKDLKEKMFKKYQKKLQKYKIDIISIGQKKNISMKIIELLERHKHANNN